MKKTLVMYTMNEIEGVKGIFEKIPIDLFDQFIVMDNHSNDGTIEFLEEHDVNVIQQKNPGRTNALIEAIEHASGDIIVNLSSDGNENPEDIPKILKKFEEGYEMVTASRFLPESKVDVEDDKLRIRVFGNKICAMLVNLCWGTNVTDTTNALRGFTKSCYKRAKLNTFGYTENFQLTIRCGKLKIKTTEIPTQELPRIGGVVKADTKGVMTDMIKVFLHELKIGNNF
jgi:glycosyltransferase involved in cell wall biosynthesis|tara:strand:+ start:1126 stop:1809 length:684 start_codon:yes stop_codon:yes gene_type:complete